MNNSGILLLPNMAGRQNKRIKLMATIKQHLR